MEVARVHNERTNRRSSGGGKSKQKGPERVRHIVAPSMGAGGSHLQAAVTHETWQQPRQHERKTQDREANEEQLERETSEDDWHVDDSFTKEHQDDTTEQGKGRSQEACGGRRPGTRHTEGEHQYEEEEWQEQEEYVVKQRDGADQRCSEGSAEQETCEVVHVFEERACERVPLEPKVLQSIIPDLGK